MSHGIGTQPSDGRAHRPRVCLIASSPITIRAFLLPHIRVLVKEMDVTVACNGAADEICDELKQLGVTTVTVPIERRPNPLVDIRALRALVRVFNDGGFDAVQTVTPKAGLLGMSAARLANVRVRIHWFTGQVWATSTGLPRRFLKAMDTLTCALATHALADSRSQRDFLVRERVARSGGVEVLGDGSISGVSTTRFRPDPAGRSAVRSSLGIPEDAFVFIFLGRLTLEKGVRELAAAFALVARDRPEVHLLVVGPDEGVESSRLTDQCRGFAHRVHLIGMVREPEGFLAAADALVLPSWREGFGTTVIEAAACCVPAVASDIYGLCDAVLNGVTGVLVPVKDPVALADAMRRFANNRRLVEALGSAARRRAIERFETTRLTEAFTDFLQRAILRSNE